MQDKTPRNEQGQGHGDWEIYYTNMQDKTPRNEQGQRHGDWLWHNITTGNIMLKCYFLYDIPYGYLYYKPLLRYDENIRIEHEYHAR